jgi:hypothetical protein
MAIVHFTSEQRGQRLNAHYVSALQGKLLTSNKKEDGHTRGHLFCFSLLSFPLSPFYLSTTNVTRALPLRTIKGEAGATSRGSQIENRPLLETHLTNQELTLTRHQETWDPLPLLKACNPYYEHSSARQHEQQ